MGAGTYLNKRLCEQWKTVPAKNKLGSEAAMAEFRRLDFPPLFFLPLHGLEVANAIRQRAFHLRRSGGSGQRAVVARERDAALARVERWLERGWFAAALADCDEALTRARTLSEK